MTPHDDLRRLRERAEEIRRDGYKCDVDRQNDLFALIDAQRAVLHDAAECLAEWERCEGDPKGSVQLRKLIDALVGKEDS